MKKPSRKISAINVVPYLDVMLVLLVIFMITAPLFNLGKVEPAKVAAESVQSVTGGLLVEYRLNGSLAMINPDTGAEENLDDVDAMVERVKTECFLNPTRPLVVVGAGEQSHQKVMALYSRIVAESECEHVGLGVQAE